MLLLVLMKKDKRKQLWLPKKAWPSFIVFGIFGMMGVQFTYFASIEEGNVAMATLLQYLSPIESSILASIEPLIATLITVVWLKESFGGYQLLGVFFVISMVFILASKSKNKKITMMSKPYHTS